jgi:parvulin-like peptidyl-prolyl isomerase
LSSKLNMTPWALVLGLTACGSPEQRGAEAVVLSPQVDRPGDVVARVNGVPILRQEVERQLEPGQSARDGVKALVRRELLAQEAARRGLTRHPSVLRAQRRAMANLLLRRHFAPRFTKKDIPKELLVKSYEMNKLHFVRPELRRVTHILVNADRRNTDDYHRRAVRVARKVREIAASGPLTEQEFKQIAGMMREQHTLMSIRAEVGTTGRHGYTLEPFAKAAFALKRKGEISPVVATRHGYHVLYLVDIYPPRNISLEEADAQLRDRVFKQAKEQAFLRWAEDLERRHKARVEKGMAGKWRPAGRAGGQSK